MSETALYCNCKEPVPQNKPIGGTAYGIHTTSQGYYQMRRRQR